MEEYSQLKHICMQWILKLLKPEQMQHQVDVCTEWEERLEQEGGNFLKHIITAGEAWLYHK